MIAIRTPNSKATQTGAPSKTLCLACCLACGIELDACQCINVYQVKNCKLNLSDVEWAKTR